MPKDIHEVLGPIRRRITEIKAGEYKGFKDETSILKAHIESFSPSDIVSKLTPILDDLNAINETVFSKVSDNVHEEINNIPEELQTDDLISSLHNHTGESKRDLMRKEVGKYKEVLSNYITKYGHSSEDDNLNRTFIPVNSTPPVISYRKYATTGLENLKNLQDALRNHIEKMPPRSFQKVFSGQNQVISDKVNWIKGGKNEFTYFLKQVYNHPEIEATSGRINWQAVENCFLFNGEEIDGKKYKSHNHPPTDTSTIDRIVCNLN